MIQTVKHNEQARKEYRFMSGLVMDAREEGLQQGIQQGIQQGKSLGLAEGEARGSRQKALQDAGNFKRLGVSIDIITQATGLSKEEVEKL